MRNADRPMILREPGADGSVRVNASFEAEVGYSAEELSARPLLEWIEPADRAQLGACLEAGEGQCEARHEMKGGGWISLGWRLRSGAEGTMVLGLDADRAVRLLRERLDVARLYESGHHRRPAPASARPSGSTIERETVSDTLETIARIVEEQNPGYKCSILLLDKAGLIVTGGAGPSLPAHYNEAVEGLVIGPTVGSCGTAAFWNVPVIVADIQNDYLWRNLAPLAKEARLGSCWSHPFSGRDGRVLGAMALYYHEPSAPTAEQLDQLKAMARMTGLAVERGRAEEALRRSEAEAQHHARLLESVTEVVTDFVGESDLDAVGAHLVEAALELTGGEYGFLGILQDDALRILAHAGAVREGAEPQAYGDALAPYRQDGKIAFTDLDNIFGHVLRSSVPVLSNDPAGDQRPSHSQPRGQPSLRNFLGAPIIRHDQVGGMLAVANKAVGFSARDQATLETLCHAARVSFERHRRTQDLESSNERLEQLTLDQARTAFALRQALNEKETLLKEIHHRVKNNLQVVSSLLTLGADQTASECETAVLRNSAHRVRAMGLIHEQLYGMAGLDRVDFGEYARQLCEALRGAFSPAAIVSVQAAVVRINVELAVPLGLILNELLTNAFKYGVADGAAPGVGGKAWDILVEVEEVQDHLVITVSDRGPGLPEGFDPGSSTSLGLGLVHSLSQQVRGSLSLSNANGAVVRLSCPLAS